MQKLTFKIKEIETQSRSRIIEVKVSVPASTSSYNAEIFVLAMLEAGEVLAKNPTPWSEFEDEGKTVYEIIEEGE